MVKVQIHTISLFPEFSLVQITLGINTPLCAFVKNDSFTFSVFKYVPRKII